MPACFSRLERGYAPPEDRYIVDARGLADVLSEATPVAHACVSRWFGYAPLDPAHLPNLDGIVFVKDSPPM